MRRAFRIAYDGRPYRGFQRQPDVQTVEDRLGSALSALGISDGLPDDYTAAGRTDAGVSALAQTVAVDSPDWCSPAALNSELPASIRAWAAADVDPDFHATHDARHRVYEYLLHAPDLDDDRVREAASGLAGEHDYHNLTPDAAGTVRDLSIRLIREDDHLRIRVGAGGFPRQLVRRLVSLLSAVGRGERPLSAVDRVLSPDPLPGSEGVPPAPAYPLLLSRVDYDVDFEVDPEGTHSARAVFDERRVEWSTRARVAGRIVDGLSGRDDRPGDGIG